MILSGPTMSVEKLTAFVISLNAPFIKITAFPNNPVAKSNFNISISKFFNRVSAIMNEFTAFFTSIIPMLSIFLVSFIIDMAFRF